MSIQPTNPLPTAEENAHSQAVFRPTHTGIRAKPEITPESSFPAMESRIPPAR